MERIKKWSTDADIHIDYKQNLVSFTNNKPILREIRIDVPFLLIFLSLYFLCFYLSQPFMAGLSLLVLIAVGVVASFNFAFTAALSSARITRLWLKYRTKKARHEVVIHNPDQEVKYRTRMESSNCIIDIEYDESVKKKLLKASLEDSELNSEPAKELTILLDGKADGTLVIKEY